jgi:dihydropteroate synthase
VFMAFPPQFGGASLRPTTIPIMRPPYRWQLRTRTLELGERTFIMGVVNVTPDSFSDGGEHFEPAKAVEHGLRMLDEGADIIDIGGESTRPGTAVLGDADGVANALPAGEELRRVLPVVRGVLRARPDAVISVDTYKAAVARAVVDEGAEIVNDVSGLQWDPAMVVACSELRCGVVIMHTRGTPREWRNLPREVDMVSLVEHDLGNRLQVALARGIQRQRIVIDPGFGFGKNFEENYPLLAHLEQLHRLGFPLLTGTSRKGFIGRTVGEARKAGFSTALRPARNDEGRAGSSTVVAAATSARNDDGRAGSSTPLRAARNGETLREERRTDGDVRPNERLSGSLAAMVASILRGVHIVRVHDVKPAVEAAAVADAVLMAES